VYQGNEEEFAVELRELVERKYLHETVPTYGALICRYRLGAMGGTVLRSMMSKPKKAKIKREEAA
jgi:hypothetical protein